MTSQTRLATVILLALLCLARPAQLAGLDVTAELAAAFDAAYNLNYDEAMRQAETVVSKHPDSSAAHRALATIIWMHLLFDRGALTIDHYLGGVSQSDIDLPAPPPARATRFHHHVERAITLAEMRVRNRASDIDARFDLGMAHGLYASWMATVEGKVRGAFGAARRAYDAHEWVLDHDADRHDAGLVVGTYRYSVAVLSFPKRWLAYLAGFGGDKARGIRMLEAAVDTPSTATDARLALALVYSRESEHRRALEIFKTLQREFPDNRLLWLEAGSAAWRAGLAAESEALLTEGLSRHDRDPRPKIPGERALWIYKRGVARLSQNHLPAAETDLRLALTQAPTGWVRGRIHLEQGKIADLRGERQAAVARYTEAESLCRAHRDPWCVGEAAKYRKRAFSFSPARGSTVD